MTARHAARPSDVDWASRIAERLPEADVLRGAAAASHRARARQSLDVVWTRPESGISTIRLTAATVTGLVSAARHEILLVSYATQAEPALEEALAGAARRRVEIVLVAE